MADKKPEKKAESSGPSLEQNIITLVVIAVLLLLVVIPAVLAGFGISSGSVFNAESFKEGFINFVAKLFTTVTFISVFLSLLFIVLISYTKMRYNQVIEDWKVAQSTLKAPINNRVISAGQSIGINTDGANQGQIILPGSEDASIGLGRLGMVEKNGQLSSVHGPEAQGGNEKWQDIESKINSANPADWRLAILEADIVMDNMLKQMGLPGETLGERLKSADPSFFNTLQEAWGAHKIRNIIAHEGTDYNLTYNEARKAIDYYRRVFEEFYFI